MVLFNRQLTPVVYRALKTYLLVWPLVWYKVVETESVGDFNIIYKEMMSQKMDQNSNFARLN